MLHHYIPFNIGNTEGHVCLSGHCLFLKDQATLLCLQMSIAVINKLARSSGNIHGLREMSQNYLSNGSNKVCFVLYNERGICGACQGKMLLHLVSLGWFKYCLEAFSAQAGGLTSLALKKYDSLCASLGKRLSRHSDCNLPQINFPK